jgi:septum formation protein
MPLWLDSRPLVLASKSKARAKILAAAGLRLEIRPADLDERAAEKGTTDAVAAARLLARAKAQAVAKTSRGRVVLGADQTLALGSERFSKPADRHGARAQLSALRGRIHALHTALALVRDDEVLFEHADSAQLAMRAFSDKFLDDYLDLAGPGALSSIGAYQIEGPGIHLFERIDGNVFTILGLPLLPLLGFLRKARFVAT